MADTLIRPEAEGDADGIREVNVAAFRDHPVSRQTEHLIVDALPSLQGEGIGSALVESGLAELRVRGANGCVLVGDPGFYGRFGFTTFPDLSYEGVPHEYVLALPLAGFAPCGSIRAHEAFEIDREQGRA